MSGSQMSLLSKRTRPLRERAGVNIGLVHSLVTTARKNPAPLLCQLAGASWLFAPVTLCELSSLVLILPAEIEGDGA